MALQVLWNSPALTFALNRDIVLSFWRLPITPMDMHALLRVTHPLVAQQAPDSLGLVIVMTEAAQSSFDAESRRLNMVLFRRVKPLLRAAAGVVEGQGMRASTFRLAATAVNIATRVDVKVFSKVGPACIHVAHHMDSLDATMLIDSVESLRGGAPATQTA